MHRHTDTDRRTRTHGHGHLWKRRTVMEKTDSYGKDGQLWKRRTLMEKTGGIAVNSTIVSATFIIIKRQSKIIYEPQPMSSITHYHSISDQ